MKIQITKNKKTDLGHTITYYVLYAHNQPSWQGDFRVKKVIVEDFGDFYITKNSYRWMLDENNNAQWYRYKDYHKKGK